MAKKGKIKNAQKIALIVQKDTKARDELRKISRDCKISMKERILAKQKLDNMRRSGNKVRVRRRCLLTGRPRGVLGMLNISRINAREIISMGYLPGIKKHTS